MKTRLPRGPQAPDPAVPEKAGLRDGDEVEMPAPVRQLDQLLDEMDEQYGSVFKRLADA